MDRRSSRFLLAIAATVTLPPLGIGCGEGHPPVDSSRTETKVRGVVTLKGKPAAGGGQVSFNPSNVERKVSSFSAPIAEDGSYELTTYTGGNQVKFSGPFLKDEPGVALSSRFCDLGSGENVVDFDLLGPTDVSRGTIYSKKSAARKR